MRRLLPLALGAVLGLAGVALAAELMQVKLREATVRAGPRHFKPPVATLRYGDQVEVLEEVDQGWLRVRLAGGALGYLHGSATTDEKLPKELPGGGGTAATRSPGSVSRDEVALAGKGFNPQVEAKYREQNPNLAEGFALVERMEMRDLAPGDLDQFLREGRLGEYAGGER